MLEKGLDINYLNNNITPLILCTHLNNNNLVNYLLKKGVDINYSGINNNMNPLIISINIGNSKIVKLLVYHGANIDICDKDFKTVTHHIIYNNKFFSTKLIKFFLMNCKNINKPDKYGNTVLNLVMQLLDWKLYMDKIVYKKLDIHFKNKLGISPVDNLSKNEYGLFLKYVVSSYINLLKHNNNWIDDLDKNIHFQLKQNNNIDKYEEKLKTK
ncbi:repeat protein [Moumouvirus goulette]|uniref:Repeat protein n=1 Tax=Moumouvirus goulette TaxID=1247379 RepID=M1PWT4_9VIRU|nr:repeat protein [Moumouvirus goulette]AGF85222.1 repeat protein [Moumouvirus goulette]